MQFPNIPFKSSYIILFKKKINLVTLRKQTTFTKISLFVTITEIDAIYWKDKTKLKLPFLICKVTICSNTRILR